MANGNDFSSTVDSLFKGMDAFLTSKSVVGDPIQVGDTTIIPLCDVNFGVGAGALGGKRSNSAGGGMGGKLSPSAMIVVKDGYAQIVNVNEDKGSLGKVLEMIPGTAEKLKAILNNRTVTDKEVEEIKEIAEDLTEEF
ncbi:MAG TPA: sporulation protein [Lachnospiraceae bacterium]|nr:sporulation protein [Eubacterium sp.]HBZ04096.1 sporulation protein [Lachnospiraceae bacterium]